MQFDCPHQLDDYVHRVGRTARIGRAGLAISFLLPSEVALVDALCAERNIRLKLHKYALATTICDETFATKIIT